MHGHEKSDPVIVARKPTNKAGRPAAEPVERRTGAEGNAGQQRTRRAQDRESVSQVLDRVRRAAGQWKKEKFTGLFHHLSIPMLRTAFFALERDAAPRIDGLTSLLSQKAKHDVPLLPQHEHPAGEHSDNRHLAKSCVAQFEQPSSGKPDAHEGPCTGDETFNNRAGCHCTQDGIDAELSYLNE